MKRVISLGAMALIGLAASACDKSSSSDPATVTRDELNPPRGLTTVTGNGQIELRWSAGNAEEDFKGFQVFAVKKSLAEVQATGVKYPKTDEKLETASIPRCKDNSKVFEAFGIPASEVDCEGDTKADATTTGTGDGMMLADTATDTLAGMVVCEDGSYAGKTKVTGTKAVSMPITGQALGDYRCVVKTDSAGKALENGQTYTFFVAAVMGDENNKLSWTSNFVADTPAMPLFEGTIKVSISQKTGENGHVVVVPGKKITALEAIAATDLVNESCKTYQASNDKPSADQPSACYVNTKNNKAGNPDGIYFGRWGVGPNDDYAYPQRIFVSVPGLDTSKIQVLLRGPQTYDPAAGADVVSTSIPGDQALANATFEKGTLYPVYGNQVFDLKVTGDDGKTHFGKLVIDIPTFDATQTPKEEADVTLNVKLVMQTATENPHYFN